MKAYMALTCKMGAYNNVLRELVLLGISIENMFLLFGPIDILVQFTNFKDLSEFKEKWFDRVIMIGADEQLITRTLTFVVISEGRQSNEEPFAFLFINAQPRNLEKVKEALLIIPEVLSVDVVLGPNDIICSIKANDRVSLEQIISQIQHNILDIEETITFIAAPREQLSNRVFSSFEG